MQFICDAPDRRTWFRIETEAEAAAESETMHHAVEKYFRREREAAEKSYRPTVTSYIERDIGLKAHILRTMPLFLTLRAHDGTPLATAMLPPEGKAFDDFRMIIVGPANADPFAGHDESIQALAKFFGLTLNRERCFPYVHYGV
ncbi:MAG: hypothetical protein ACXWLZ_11455 [Rhizomicrobium sp.]